MNQSSSQVSEFDINLEGAQYHAHTTLKATYMTLK